MKTNTWYIKLGTAKISNVLVMYLYLLHVIVIKNKETPAFHVIFEQKYYE